MRDGSDIAGLLLGWYDRHARILPWRVSPADQRRGLRADPYRVWLSEVMLQQTTVPAVRPYFEEFTARWPDVHALAGAEDAQVMAAWAGLGYYARARNLLKCARCVVADHGGSFPMNAAGLASLPGIGPYTAAAVAAIAFDEPATVVDGNVERVVARLFAITTPLPEAKAEFARAAATLTPELRPGDYAQAMMDLGATLCKPRNPSCGICPIAAHCIARARGIASDLPRRVAKTPKPVRRGTAFLARRDDGSWLLERRPDRGLLGGMLGWPGSDWSVAPEIPVPPLDADWQALGAEVRHTFTHFHLRLGLVVAQVPLSAEPRLGQFHSPEQFTRGDLPTVMRKAFDLARGHLDAD